MDKRAVLEIQWLKSVTWGFFVLCAMLIPKSNIQNFLRHQDKNIGSLRILLCCYKNGALSHDNHYKLLNFDQFLS